MQAYSSQIFKMWSDRYFYKKVSGGDTMYFLFGDAPLLQTDKSGGFNH